ncbi:MAG: hypothetical protein QOF57_577 [Frankiaceae bacterium]|nr:hypothetical protein [Frankiaceae bacterium]
MISTEQIGSLQGATVIGADGERIGEVGQVLVDTATGAPEWVSVQTGLLGNRQTLVPITEATLGSGELTVPFTKDQIKAAPNIAPDQDLSQEEESRLYAHYGVSYSDAPSPSGLPETGQGMTGRESRDMGDFESGRPRTNDDAMTRSEEQVRVGTEKVQTGVARLRKYVETEQVNVPVTVTKEKVRLETEPITDANRDDAMAGPEISEGEHEVTLTEERPVVAKETVPVERVRLEKDTVAEEQNVSETVRKERIATDGVDDVYPEEPGVPQTDRNLR